MHLGSSGMFTFLGETGWLFLICDDWAQMLPPSKAIFQHPVWIRSFFLLLVIVWI
jgi:hypothetical protein